MRILEGVRRLDLSRHIGTELAGVQLVDLSDEGIAEVRQLAAERGVIVFRAQHMDLNDQVAVGRRLGPLYIHPIYCDQEPPEAVRIHSDGTSKYFAGDSWHSDASWDEQPPGLSMLRIEVTPDVGGDTTFVSTYGAYDTLSDRMKAFVAELRAVHACRNVRAKDFPSHSHPVVCSHPLTGRRSLYVNAAFTESIEDLTRSESESLLAFLFAHISGNVSLQCRVRWSPQTVTIWDNRCTQHHASWDYFPETRSGWRVATIGECPRLDVEERS